ncbi:hypothetical protein Q4566_12780 [Tamlana sp. 2_MG-2023]|nr:MULTISPECIES: hypothetical protein [unclassified Tamlana]MDO6761078.1 hypothetical protein [Tamlana sp. 2_MG-2023]MDO6791589.1 hypothetical protein [Tamlana sp. 1_MG-2023]
MGSFLSNEKVELDVEVFENELHLSGEDDGEAWTDVFTRVQ